MYPPMFDYYGYPPYGGGGTMLEETMVITTTTPVVVISVVVVVVVAAGHTEGEVLKPRTQKTKFLLTRGHCFC